VSLTLTPKIARALAAEAERAWPREACGLLFGPAGEPERVTTWVPMENKSERPLHSFALDPLAHLAELKRAERAGLRQRAIVHSHPSGGAALSAADREDAWLWPGLAWLVVAVDGGRAGAPRAWRHDAGQVVPVPLEIAELTAGRPAA
jgi:proteasome lid subunit RPN8/RPN11